MNERKRSSPCVGCMRVMDPEECDNKRCALWQEWFLDRWDRLHRQYLALIQRKGGRQ